MWSTANVPTANDDLQMNNGRCKNGRYSFTVVDRCRPRSGYVRANLGDPGGSECFSHWPSVFGRVPMRRRPGKLSWSWCLGHGSQWFVHSLFVKLDRWSRKVENCPELEWTLRSRQNSYQETPVSSPFHAQLFDGSLPIRLEWLPKCPVGKSIHWLSKKYVLTVAKCSSIYLFGRIFWMVFSPPHLETAFSSVLRCRFELRSHYPPRAFHEKSWRQINS